MRLCENGEASVALRHGPVFERAVVPVFLVRLGLRRLFLLVLHWLQVGVARDITRRVSLEIPPRDADTRREQKILFIFWVHFTIDEGKSKE